MAKRRFELASGSSSEFWEITVRGKELSVTFGRIGTAGRTQDKQLASAAAAEQEAARLIASKVKKGYEEVTGAAKQRGEAAASSLSAGDPSYRRLR